MSTKRPRTNSINVFFVDVGWIFAVSGRLPSIEVRLWRFFGCMCPQLPIGSFSPLGGAHRCQAPSCCRSPTLSFVQRTARWRQAGRALSCVLVFVHIALRWERGGAARPCAMFEGRRGVREKEREGTRAGVLWAHVMPMSWRGIDELKNTGLGDQ